jgi:hypothetical protein
MSPARPAGTWTVRIVRARSILNLLSSLEFVVAIQKRHSLAGIAYQAWSITEMLHGVTQSVSISEGIAMGPMAVLEGQSLSAFIGVCLMILGGATFVWGQWAWEKHTKAGRVLLLLMSAFLLSAGLMFMGVVNYLEREWGM